MAKLQSHNGIIRLTLRRWCFTLFMLCPSVALAFTTQGSGYFCYQSETQALQNARNIAKAQAEQRCAQQHLQVLQLQWIASKRLPQQCQILQTASFQCAPQQN